MIIISFQRGDGGVIRVESYTFSCSVWFILLQEASSSRFQDVESDTLLTICSCKIYTELWSDFV